MTRLFPALAHNQVMHGAVQCLLTGLLALGVVLLLRRRVPKLFGEVALAEIRGLAQILAVGAILALLLHGPQWTSIFVLAGMALAAASIVRKRARQIPRIYSLALAGITGGAGAVLTLLVILGVIPLGISMLVPVGSMVIANTMNTQSMFLDRLRGEIAAHVGEIESALALGATAEKAIERSMQAAFRASLIPSIDNLRSLGIVWIPGMMAGIVLSGASPVYAALYQFVVLTTILASTGLSCLVTSYLVVGRVFSRHEQLLLRG
ncbi:ABC transporter permease [Silvibacterium dinghuense]|uniref:ABC transporter permease n=2 Tax=Silvibacterium dinghuense TaxID=1560006 RepID=A0A4Q1SK58_9BACT|nr:ABC transporter permease [Silvibacterium dinghuense]